MASISGYVPEMERIFQFISCYIEMLLLQLACKLTLVLNDLIKFLPLQMSKECFSG